MGALRPGGGGGSVAAADITDATATGRALVTATDAAAAQAVIAPYAAVALSGGGWTTSTDGGGTSAASVSGGTLSITSEGGAAHYARAARPVLDGLAVEYVARITTTSGAVAGQAIGLMVADTISAGSFLLAMARGDGMVYVYDPGGPTSGVAVADILGGQGWVRLVVRGDTVCAYAGVGTGGAPPTAWTPCGYATRAARGQPWGVVALQASSDDGTSTWTWTCTDLRARVLS